MQYKAIIQYWNWHSSLVQPFGCSVHLSHEDRDRFVEEYWAEMPAETQKKYAAPSGKSQVMQVPESKYNFLIGLKNAGIPGFRYHEIPDWIKECMK